MAECYLYMAAATLAWALTCLWLLIVTVRQDYEFRLRIAVLLAERGVMRGREIVAATRLPNSTVYVWLYRMEELGIIESWPDPGGVKGQRMYRLGGKA